MLYAIMCKDKPDTLQKRIDARSAHLERLNVLNEKGRLMAGPFIGASGNPEGSLFIEAENEPGACALANTDSFATAGMFEQFEVRPFRRTVNNPEG